MPPILAENLSGKAVTGADGAEIGMLYNITMDVETGDLKHLLVEPHEDARPVDFETDEAGRYLVPVSNVRAVKDHMIVKR